MSIKYNEENMTFFKKKKIVTMGKNALPASVYFAEFQFLSFSIAGFISR